MNKFIKALFAIVFLAGLASCLKDTNYDENKTGNNLSNVPKIIELSPLVNPPYHDGQFLLNFKDADTTLNFVPVRLASIDPAAEDITVTLTIANTDALLTAYNDKNGTDVIPMPANLYSFPNGLTVVIPKGERSANLQITVNSAKFDADYTYALGVSIASIDKPGYTASGNFGDFVTSIGAKNKYDGSYVVTGTLVDVASAGIGPYTPSWDADLVTQGGKAVTVIDQTYSGINGHPIKSGGSASYYGSFGMIFKFDPVTNKAISVTSPYVPAANTRYAQIDATYDSFWDPVTRNITIKYYMYQPSVVAVGPRVTFVETWTYVGPRP